MPHPRRLCRGRSKLHLRALRTCTRALPPLVGSHEGLTNGTDVRGGRRHVQPRCRVIHRPYRRAQCVCSSARTKFLHPPPLHCPDLSNRRRRAACNGTPPPPRSSSLVGFTSPSSRCFTPSPHCPRTPPLRPPFAPPAARLRARHCAPHRSDDGPHGIVLARVRITGAGLRGSPLLLPLCVPGEALPRCACSSSSLLPTRPRSLSVKTPLRKHSAAVTVVINTEG